MRDDFTRANVPHGTADAQYSISGASSGARGAEYSILRGMTPVPAVAGADPQLNETALRIIINTSGYSDENGWCWLTQAQHAALAGRNRNTIARAQNLLARIGYLLVGHNLYDPRRRRKRQTVYRVTDPPATSHT